jgi:peptide/nickel transport system ATP-binding protein
MTALTVDGLSVSYGSGRAAADVVSAVSFDLAKGTTLGLVGESGSGKSTVAKAIVGLVPVREGTISLHGSAVTRSRGDRKRLVREVQMVFQDPNSTLNPRLTVATALTEAANLLPPGERYDVENLMALVELPAFLRDRFPHQLSGGQRQRVAIARALAVRPSVLIADEVTASLDVSVQASVLNLLMGLREQLGISCLFISHNIAVVRHVSDEIAVMHDSKLVEKGASELVLAHPRAPYTKTLLAAVPRPFAAAADRSENPSHCPEVRS